MGQSWTDYQTFASKASIIFENAWDMYGWTTVSAETEIRLVHFKYDNNSEKKFVIERS